MDAVSKDDGASRAAIGPLYELMISLIEALHAQTAAIDALAESNMALVDAMAEPEEDPDPDQVRTFD